VEHVSPPLGTVWVDDGLTFGEPIEESSIEHFHGFQLEAAKKGAHAVPKVLFTVQFL
jgi:hypothetical protein